MDIVNLFKHYILHPAAPAARQPSELAQSSSSSQHQLDSKESENFEVSGIFSDAREVQPNSVFVAIRGVQKDGHQFIAQAIQQGARALVVENISSVPASFAERVYVVLNTRRALSDLAARFYDHPSLKLRCLGVTGTNGKSSIVNLVEHILNSVQISTGVMGTIDHHLGQRHWQTQLTTPGPLEIQNRLKEFLDLGAQAVAMEVSSHALEQNRVDHIAFQTVIFTNLTRDHLDYHKNMEDYLKAKELLFTEILDNSPVQPCFAIVNLNTKYGRKMKISHSAILWTYGRSDCDFTYKILDLSFKGTKFSLKTPLEEIFFEIPLIGEHNVENVVASALGALSFGVPLVQAAKSLENFKGVPGRLQGVSNNKGFHVFIDYAHTPDALENVLRTLKIIRGKGKQKIICIFGCGGDRDPGKRPLMGAIAEKYSTKVILTNDNPRTENPDQIIEQIKSGISKKFLSDHVVIEKDRPKAISMGMKTLNSGDVLLIAGKGHEDYQIIGTEKIHMSDFEIANDILKGVQVWA